MATEFGSRTLRLAVPPRWTTVLHQAGLRRTRARVAVLEELDAARAPLSHGALVKSLAHLGLDQATVYRNLIDLVEVGLVVREDVGRLWRFELVRGHGRAHASEHPHFVCGECGAVSCLPGGVVHVSPGRGVPRAVQRPGVEVQLRGTCDACTGRQDRAAKRRPTGLRAQ